uniref:Putative nebulin n=1 Tax=Schistosoma mansoni TaxID=6183 RepID=A0A5K4ES25_SCHMA
MALSICNYHGGYDKKPYCAAHTPKPTSFTFIPDTPELLRVANNTRMFSSIRYSADAQRIRSKITSFPDDLWTQHTLRLSKQYSEVS